MMAIPTLLDKFAIIIKILRLLQVDYLRNENIQMCDFRCKRDIHSIGILSSFEIGEEIKNSNIYINEFNPDNLKDRGLDVTCSDKYYSMLQL